MGYQLRTRWLEWQNFTPMPEIESLKRQIETVRFIIDDLEDQIVAAPSTALYPEDAIKELTTHREVMREVLATLERLMPPF